MSYDPDDTICAIGTASGGAARGMVRISGSESLVIAERLFRAADGNSLAVIRQPSVVAGSLELEFDNEQRQANPALPRSLERDIRSIECDLFVWPTNRSYTREPVVELHTVGSPPVLRAALSSVCRAGARLAEPGEFTLRAFLAGRLDLTQAEAVLGVIDAGGSDELDVALAQLAGGLASPLHQLRDDLLQILAELEAGLDFVEEDIRFISQRDTLNRLESASGLLDGVSEQIGSRLTSPDLPQVAIVGPPNVGKSSLFNAIVGRYGVNNGESTASPALVSSRRGTTRDYLTAAISFNGVMCELIDTAGVDIEATTSDRSIDARAQTVATERRRQATVRAFCTEAFYWSDREAPERGDGGENDCDLIVLTKIDLGDATRAADIARVFPQPTGRPIVVTSSTTGAGLQDVCEAVRRLLTRDGNAGRRNGVVATTAERCRESVRLAASAIQTAIQLTIDNSGDELIAAELREALGELGKVVGAVYTDDLLDRIFKTFCIGK